MKSMRLNTRKLIDVLINIIFPLSLGLLIYIFVHEKTFYNLIFPTEKQFQAEGFVGVFVCSWLCDMLWSYALTHTLYLALEPFESRIFLAALISGALGIALEILQLINAISGTFDVLDIIFELIAIGIAISVIKKERKK